MPIEKQPHEAVAWVVLESANCLKQVGDLHGKLLACSALLPAQDALADSLEQCLDWCVSNPLTEQSVPLGLRKVCDKVLRYFLDPGVLCDRERPEQIGISRM